MVQPTKEINRSTANNRLELEFDQPVVNIGGDPANDITLRGEGVQPFHAAILVREGEWRLIPLAPNAEIILDGNPVNEPGARVNPDQKIELSDYSLVLKPNGTPTSMHIELQKLQKFEKELTIAVPAAPPPVTWVSQAGENPIIARLISSQLEVAVEQTAVIELEVVNSGPIVARFDIMVEDLSPDWVAIRPLDVNLVEGGLANITIEITPPRLPTSAAGKHPFRLVITSPNYPGVVSEIQADLTIQPYYEFLLGNLAPKQQSISWKKHTGQVMLPVANQGNSVANLEVMAADEENGCTFEIHVDEEITRSRQATVSIPAGGTYAMPIDITPLKQPFIALRSRRYHYTTSVQVAQMPTTAQTVSGSAVSHPMIGWWGIALSVLAVLVAILIIIQPNIEYFQASTGKDVIELGDSTELEWRVSPFATRLNISGIDKAITRDLNHITITPAQSTTYELVASNWLASLLSLEQNMIATILVVPPSPHINVFEVDSTTVKKGEPSKIRWSVTQADKVLLTIDEVVYELPADQFSGEREITLEKDAIITLEATSLSGSELRSYLVRVVPPSINVKTFTVWVRPAQASATASVTSSSTVAVSSIIPVTGQQQGDFSERYVGLVPAEGTENGYRVEFFQPERELEKGEQIMVEWEIDGVDTLAIAPFTDVLPNKGMQPFFPQESMNFVLTAKSGELERVFMLPVTVFDGEPPTAPTIDFFKASPSALVGAGDVQFAWSISGVATKIELSSGGTVLATDLAKQGFKTLNVAKTSTFILTAWNGDLSKAETLEVIINPALKRSTLTVDDVSPRATYFRVGDSVEVTTSIVGLDQEVGTPEPTGKITVTDGFAVCAIELPLKTCTLTFTSAGTKQIRASYAGDKIYLPSDSAIYTKDVIIVDANKVSLSVSFFSPAGKDLQGNDVAAKPLLANAAGIFERRIGQGLMIDVSVIPQNKPISDEDGEVTVRYCPEDASGNRIETQCITAGPSTVAKPTDPTSTIGRASVVIGQLNQKGRYSLIIAYRHKNGAFEPALLGNTTQDKIEVIVDKGWLVLIPQTSLSGVTCNYKTCVLPQNTLTNIIFDAKLLTDDQGDAAVGNDMVVNLFPSYTRPSSLQVSASVVRNPTDQINWTSKCAWQVSSSLYQLNCQNVTTQEALDVSYSFLSTDSNYLVYTNGPPVRLEIRYPSYFQFPDFSDPAISPDAPFHNVYVGKKIELLQGNIVLKERTNVITPADYYITLQGGNIGDYVRVQSTSQSCALDPTSGIKVTQVDPATDSCIIYFKRPTAQQLPLTLQFSYEGAVSYGAVTQTTNVTVQKQTGLTARWNPPAPQKNTFEAFDEVVTFNCSNTTACGDPSTGLGFSYESISEATLDLDSSSAGSDCAIISQNLSGSRITLPTRDENAGAPSITFNMSCATPGPRSLGMVFSGTSSERFALNPSLSATDNGSLFSFSIIAQSVTISVVVNQNSGSANIINNDAISELISGDQYWLQLTLTGVPVGTVLNSADDYVRLDIPTQLEGYISDLDSTCEKDPTGTFYKFTLNNTGQPAGQWISNRCSFFLNSAGTLGTNPQLRFSLVTLNNRLSGLKNIGLPASVTQRAGVIQATVSRLNRPLSDPSPVFINVSSGGTVSELYVGEVYELSLTLTFDAGTIFNQIFFHPIIRLPNELRNAVAQTDASTCLNTQDVSNPAVFNLAWESEGSNVFRAKCRIQIGSAVTIPANSVISYELRFDAGWLGAIDVQFASLNLPSATLKRTINLTSTILPTANVSGTTNAWYITSHPYVQITFPADDNHVQYNAFDTALTSLSVRINNNTSALTCDLGTLANTVTCPIPDTAEILTDNVTITYNGTDIFAANAAVNLPYSIRKIPTVIALSDIQLTNSDGTNPQPFPESYRCNNCTDTSPIYYLLTGKTYYIRVSVRPTVTIYGTTPVVDSGRIVMTYTADPSTFNSTIYNFNRASTVSNGVANMASLTMVNTYAMWNATFSYTATYEGNSTFAASPTLTNSGRSTMLRQQLTLNVVNWGSAGFSIEDVFVSGTALKDAYGDDRYCLDVYVEIGTSSVITCEGQSCWNRVTGGTSEKVAAYCDGTSGPLAGSSYSYSGDADDGQISTDDTDFQPTDQNAAFQIIIRSLRYLYITNRNWPPQ